MPTVQSTYTERFSVAREGHKGNGELCNVISLICEESGGIDFGKPVVHGANDGGATLVKAASTSVVGVTLVDDSSPHSNTTSATGKYLQYRSMKVLEFGTIWVQASVAVEPGEKVYVIKTSGKFTNVATNNIDINARWITTAAANALAVIRIG